MEARDGKSMPLQDYLALDRRTDERWEFIDGEAWAMAGASIEHNVVAANLLVALRAALRDRDCFALPEGQKVATPATRGYHYPDATVVCGRIAVDATDDHAITNPILLVEVLSPSTADYDRGRKFRHYRTLESLREYVLIHVEERLVEHHRRIEQGKWLMTEMRDTEVRLESLDVTLAWNDLWLDLDRLAAARTAG